MQRDTQREEDVKTEAGTRVMPLQAGNAKGCQETWKSGWGREGFDHPLTPSTDLTLRRPWFQTSDLQNCETVNFCCFKLPSLWWFVLAALGNEYTWQTSALVGPDLCLKFCAQLSLSRALWWPMSFQQTCAWETGLWGFLSWPPHTGSLQPFWSF